MKRTNARHLLLFFLLIPFMHFPSSAQDITGIWRGYFITESFDQYKFELQVKQSGNTVTGVSYSYHSTVFYGKATLTGNFNRDGQSALIREIKTIELRMAGGSQACIMNCILSYDRSGKEEFLEGTFTSKFEKAGFMNKQGDNCGGGKVYLRKVSTSDFYVEPFLRDKPITTPVILNKPPVKNPTLVKKPPVKKDIVKAKSRTPNNKTTVIKKPIVKTTITSFTKKAPIILNKTPIKKDITKTKMSPPDKKPTVSKPSFTKAVVKTNKPPVTKSIIDSNKITTPVIKTNPPVVVVKPAVLKDRSNELMKELTVHNEDVTVKLYDNGEVDGDSISVYYDNKLVLSNKGLSTVPLIIKLKMDEDNSEHELVMVALNEGLIPPNTALMIVESGEQRFNVQITSSEQKNAVVRFKYQKPK